MAVFKSYTGEFQAFDEAPSRQGSPQPDQAPRATRTPKLSFGTERPRVRRRGSTGRTGQTRRAKRGGQPGGTIGAPPSLPPAAPMPHESLRPIGGVEQFGDAAALARIPGIGQPGSLGGMTGVRRPRRG